MKTKVDVIKEGLRGSMARRWIAKFDASFVVDTEKSIRFGFLKVLFDSIKTYQIFIRYLK